MTPAVAAPVLAEIWSTLETLTDPEIPVITLREMGILRDVRLAADARLEVVITPTYSGCLRYRPWPGMGNSGALRMKRDNQPRCLRSNQPNIRVGRKITHGSPLASTTRSCSRLLRE